MLRRIILLYTIYNTIIYYIKSNISDTLKNIYYGVTVQLVKIHICLFYNLVYRCIISQP